MYRDGTGYGQAAIDYILALDAAGVDVVCRPLKLNDRQHKPSLRVLQLEQKSARGCDMVIQHTLPHLMSYDGHFKKCVGLFASETSHFKASSWAQRLNTMDEVWAISRQQEAACKASGVTRPVRVVPHATDITRFQRSHEPLEALRPYRDRGEFLFYAIGEFVRRKNYASLLKAFHTEFDPSEPVRLVIKADTPADAVSEFCTKIKEALKLHGGNLAVYQDEIIISDRLTDEGMLRLHAACDCFVLPSYGEAWCIPAFDAMAMGKTPIVPYWGGFCDYMRRNTGWLVHTHDEVVFGIQDSFEDLYTGTETWAGVDVPHLRRCMREAYEDRKQREEKAAKGIERAYDFSHEAVGLRMRELLNEHNQGQGDSMAATA